MGISCIVPKVSVLIYTICVPEEKAVKKQSLELPE